ncbi:MAG: hypothetical protein GYB50_26885 [Rhodobacteraceae bacterium]|nr:hypothetical protein [Paracoccaceae bacterium]
MGFWHIEDLEDFWALRELDKDLPDDQRGRVGEARKEAFHVRRRLGANIPRGGARSEKQTALAKKRYANKSARRVIVSAKRGRPIGYDGDVSKRALVAQKKESLLLDGLLPNRGKRWQPMRRRLRSRSTAEIDVEKFSFLTHPNYVVQALSEIAEAESAHMAARINFHDEDCLDIGAWLVLAAMRSEMVPIFTGGAMSNVVASVIAALQMEQALRMRVPQIDEETQNVWSFPLRARRAAGTSTSATQFLDTQDYEEVATELCEAIDVWLDACVEQQLTLQGRRSVMRLVTETLDNAERHARPDFENDGDWLMTGFMSTAEDDSEVRFKCQLALLSVGTPISKTVINCDDATRAMMEQYVAAHLQSGPRLRHMDDHLRTIYALQDMVSRDRVATEGQRGGTGFSDIIKMFADLAGHDRDGIFARMAIISGRTCLHLDQNLCESAVDKCNGGKFNIWLNSAQSSDIPPHESAVQELDRDFNGTLITMAFELDPEYLERTADG